VHLVTDEKIFTTATPKKHRMTNCVHLGPYSKQTERKDIATKCRRSTFSQALMASVSESQVVDDAPV